jgi:hypothetical protein
MRVRKNIYIKFGQLSYLLRKTGKIKKEDVVKRMWFQDYNDIVGIGIEIETKK